MKISAGVIAALLFTGLIFSCASTPSQGGGGRGGSKGGPALYYGEGDGGSQIEAMNAAKMEAVRKAVEEMIGLPAASAKKPEIAKLIYDTGNANNFVLNDTVQILDRSQNGSSWNVQLMIAVNLNMIDNIMRSNEIWGGKVTPGSEPGSGAVGAQGSPAPAGTTAASGGEKTAESSSSDDDSSAAVSEEYEPTPEEKRFINDYLDDMIYMVYFDEDSAEDPFLAESAVGIANSYLANQSVEVVDFSQIEQIKEDQQMAYEEQTGMEISIIQWIAQKLNADVYIELDARTSGETDKGNYYGKANITLKIFESSTGKLLGSVPYNSPRTFSKSSQMDAVNNALQSSIYKAMPLAMDQVQAYMADALKDGIIYDLVVQNTPDPKLMSDFRRKLKRKVSDLRTLSSSDEETKYRVSFFGFIEDLEDTIYDVAESIPGLEGMYRVYFRGKSITFDTGLY